MIIYVHRLTLHWMFLLRKQLSILHNFTYIPSSLDLEGVPLEYGLFCSSSTLLCSEDVKSLSGVTSSCRIFKITIYWLFETSLRRCNYDFSEAKSEMMFQVPFLTDIVSSLIKEALNLTDGSSIFEWRSFIIEKGSVILDRRTSILDKRDFIFDRCSFILDKRSFL